MNRDYRLLLTENLYEIVDAAMATITPARIKMNPSHCADTLSLVRESLVIIKRLEESSNESKTS